MGFAWTVPGDQRFSTVVRGGAGVYFDTGQTATAVQGTQGGYPYTSSNFNTSSGQTYQTLNFGTNTTQAALPLSTAYLVDGHLQSPRIYEWSLTVEQLLGKDTKLSTSYIGNDGEKLVGEDKYSNTKTEQGTFPVNTATVRANGSLFIITNQSHSNYQALQSQLTSKIGARLDALVSYTWSHAEDNGSNDFSAVGALATNPLSNSSNDIRHIFATAIHYAPSALSSERVIHAVTSGWAFDTIARLQTASPLTVTVSNTNPNAFLSNADIVAGQPFILNEHTDSFGKVVPGGRLLNWAAFTSPPKDSNGFPLRPGNGPTNGYRLFGLKQWDLAMNRSWKMWERVDLNFRVDAFNILNTPNFTGANTSWSATNASTFGRVTNTYAGGYGSTPSNGGQSGTQLAVFQNGGPRSLQLGMKLKF